MYQKTSTFSCPKCTIVVYFHPMSIFVLPNIYNIVFNVHLKFSSLIIGKITRSKLPCPSIITKYNVMLIFCFKYNAQNGGKLHGPKEKIHNNIYIISGCE
jgi:hypothetical protein